MLNHKFRLGLSFVTVLMLFLLAGCAGKGKPAVTEETKLTTPITISSIQMVPTEQYYETSGTVKANIVSKIAPKVMGEVTAVYVKSGEAVQAGQVLAEVRDPDIRQKLAAAEAGQREARKGLELAERNKALQTVTYQRYEQLYGQAAISKQQLDEIRTQFEMAQLSYEQAAATTDRATAGLSEVAAGSRIISPISGIVTEKNLEVGNMLQAGVPVITVEDNHSFVVECYVEAGLSEQIHPGMKAWFDGDNGKTIQGVVKEIVPAVDTASRSFFVKVALSDGNAKTGQYGKVRFPIGQQPMLVVPQQAVVTKGQLTGVYVLDEKKQIWYRLVRLGRQHDGVAEIVTGLKSGEMVVIGGVESAVDGATAGEVKKL